MSDDRGWWYRYPFPPFTEFSGEQVPMAWAVMILLVVALGLTASALNRKTVARHIAEGTMPRSKRLQQQVVAVAAKSGIVPPWSVDDTSTDDPPVDATED